MDIADRIQKLRKEKGVSQEELANQTGVSRQAVSKWESGKSLPDLDKLVLLSNYFKVSTDYLLKGLKESVLQDRMVQGEQEQPLMREELDQELYQLVKREEKEKKKTSDWLKLMFPIAMTAAILVIYFIFYR